MKKINLILRKCKSLSRQLGRSSSYSSLRSKSTREDVWVDKHEDEEELETIFVGSTRKRYVISSKYLSHPLVKALLEKSKDKHGEEVLVMKCEEVIGLVIKGHDHFNSVFIAVYGKDHDSVTLYTYSWGFILILKRQ
ncbi:hypothetical protein GH714_001390 [Hevea brasiliensis]|uniref:Auxin-responsive protein n=1 Tax=Hevea brasiliensis TaxID=3981 RepID=A0A6A6M7L7_HEVBR|nr:hypothetical protein GH714_001390 [Hevea brasiliensis]